MNRIDVLQALLDQRPRATYLEIGVQKGKALLKLRAQRKIAVDPEFHIPHMRCWTSCFKNPSNFANQYFEMTSDAFFAEHAQVVNSGIDVAFVDGLHTHEQSHRDVCNVLKYLKHDGVIVMHDCNPISAAAALFAYTPDEAALQGHPEWTGEWTGDVYKAVMQLRAERSDLSTCVLDCDHGLGIIRRGKPDSTLKLSLDQIARMTYEDFAPRRRELLNLRSPELFPSEFRRAA